MHTNNTNKKISTLTGVIIIIATAILLFGGVFAYQNYFNLKEEVKNNETANWETYTNTEYGISFKYPENWYVELADPSRDLFFLISPQTKDTIDEANKNNTAHGGPDIYLQLTNQGLGLQNPPDNWGLIKKTAIGNRDWYRYTESRVNYVTYTPDNNSTWSFNFSFGWEKQAINIISTFKFIK